jgi:ribosomal protein L22
MSPAPNSDAPATPERGEAAAGDAERARPTEAESAGGRQDAPRADPSDQPHAGADSGERDEAELAEEAAAEQAQGASAKQKRRRTPRVRKGAASKADEPSDEQPQAPPPAPRAQEGKAAEAGTPQGGAGAPAERPAPRPTKATRRRRRVVRARARYVRTSARKARLVCAQLQGKSVAQARAILAFTPRAVARDWSRLLESAVANAENNHELLEEDLIIREAYADEGPTIKRFRPRAMGRATPIRKRTSHLTITLTASSSQDKRAS